MLAASPNVGRGIKEVGLWFLVATAVIGCGLFIGLGSWKSYVIGQKLDQAKTLETDLWLVVASLQDIFQVVDGLSIPDNCSVFIGNLEQPNQYNESTFRIVSEGDPDTSLRFNTSLITPDAIRTLEIQNTSGIVAYLSDIVEQEDVFHDGTFAIFHAADPTRELRFSLTNLDSSSTRSLVFQDKPGTIAYLSDIPAFTTAFSDAEFKITGLDSTKAMVLDASIIGTDTTRTLRAQNVSGTVAYETDITWEDGVYSDDTFAIFDPDDSTQQAKFDLGDVSTSTNISVWIQSRSGEIGYLSDTSAGVTVDITGTRQFPTSSIEGFSTFQEGSVVALRIYACGGGGGSFSGCLGIPTTSDIEIISVGGGSASAIDGIMVTNVSGLYTHFDITVGNGGIPSSDGVFTIGTSGGNGGTTRILATTTDPEVDRLDLRAYGGGGGNTATLSSDPSTYGGCGGGNGGAPRVVLAVQQPGIAGDEGGVPGVCGDATNKQPVVPKFRFPWRGGTHGSGRRFRTDLGYAICDGTATSCRASHMVGGGEGGSISGNRWDSQGGGGLFGRGGWANVDPEANSCAGAGSPSPLLSDGTCPYVSSIDLDRNLVRRRGATGRVIIQYWTA